MNIIFACDNSQTLMHEFIKLGHNCVSCDLLPCSGNYPKLHYQKDIFEVLKEHKFDALIGFPPCTFLCKAQMHLCISSPGRAQKRDNAVLFFKKLFELDIKYIALENPIGYLNTNYLPPNQILQPHYFGDKYSKDICLWLKNFPPVIHTYYYLGKKRKTKNHTNSRMSQEQKSFIKSSWKYFPNMCREIANQWNFNN